MRVRLWMTGGLALCLGFAIAYGQNDDYAPSVAEHRPLPIGPAFDGPEIAGVFAGRFPTFTAQKQSLLITPSFFDTIYIRRNEECARLQVSETERDFEVRCEK